MQIILAVRKIFSKATPKSGGNLKIPPFYKNEFAAFVNPKYIPLKVKASDNVAKLMTFLEENYGTPPDRQTLSYCGRPLREGATLADFNIKDGTMVSATVDFSRRRRKMKVAGGAQ